MVKGPHSYELQSHAELAAIDINKTLQAFVDREHEFRFLAVQPYLLDGSPYPSLAVSNLVTTMCLVWDP